MLSGMMMMQLSGLSQNEKKIDTGQICLLRADALYHIARSDSLTQYKKLVKEKQKDIDSLFTALKLLDSAIKEYKGKDILYADIRRLTEDQIKDLRDEIKILKDEIKRMRRSRTWDRVIQVGVIGVLTYLYITK